MPFTHIDLIGLNKYDMHDAPIVRTNAELKTLAESGQKSFSIAGMRHSQGGHTALKNESMVFTEAMELQIKKIKEVKEIMGVGGVVGIQEIEETDPNPPNLKLIKVNAGATWSDLHFYLGPMGYAPLVHQSSPHFSIGGSLSVDCHGREVTEGALSNTVESMTVLTNKDGNLQEIKASRTLNSDLFWATLGGYGACGVILDATIRVTKNIKMSKFGTYIDEHNELIKYFNTAKNGKRKTTSNVDQHINMFYAWMSISNIQDEYLTHAMVYEYVPEKEYKTQDNYVYSMRCSWLKNESWASTEAMRSAWAAGRKDSTLRGQLFTEIANMTVVPKNSPPEDFLINFLREEISFTSTKGEANNVDLLQEFFIPLPNITIFLTQLRDELLPFKSTTLELLSCTLRIIQSPKERRGKPFLSYAYDGDEFPRDTPMISVALEVKVKKSTSDNFDLVSHPNYIVNPEAIIDIQAIIDKALALGGSYYLPYYKIASLNQFHNAYPEHNEWKAAADTWNPKMPENGGKRMFSNEFLNQHLEI